MSRTNQRSITKTKTVSSPSGKSVEAGTKILKNAIRTKTSASVASLNSNRGKNYISNLLAKLPHLLRHKLITKAEHDDFKKLYKEYRGK